MENKPTLDRELIFPILIGGLSIIGIAVVLLLGRARNQPAQVATTPSATPFQYIYLGTEPAVSTPFTEGSEIAPEFEETSVVGPPPGVTPISVSPTRPSPSSLVTPTRASSVSTPLVLGTANVTGTPDRFPTPTVNHTATASNTYDDTDPRLVYSGTWVSQTGLPIGTDNTPFQGTLHVSESAAAGNSVTFSFTGRELQLYYDAGPSLGTLTLLFDNDTLGIDLNQGQGLDGVEIFALDDAGSHRVTIQHTDGGSVNIDKVIIPAATPTPTPTATPTQ